MQNRIDKATLEKVSQVIATGVYGEEMSEYSRKKHVDPIAEKAIEMHLSALAANGMVVVSQDALKVVEESKALLKHQVDQSSSVQAKSQINWSFECLNAAVWSILKPVERNLYAALVNFTRIDPSAVAKPELVIEKEDNVVFVQRHSMSAVESS
jgi:hypothetical protein